MPGGYLTGELTDEAALYNIMGMRSMLRGGEQAQLVRKNCVHWHTAVAAAVLVAAATR